ncbi:hypothetical protein G7Z17_g9809 [Cylindrodendrum hubeiense]|uniref:Uncharacterized protein n=1 Tax=Cylindrodendrum hubeiense TaxID=595255 RepID=A0A9P5L7T4_9HYPO|nr:hypothetical protein G7Z17_g9809 [Cylindrodendrum hubeiense]
MTRDDDSSSTALDRFGNSSNTDSKPARFGFNSSFSTSGSISASTKSSSAQSDSDPTSSSSNASMFGPVDTELSWPDRSMASVALSPYSPLALRSLPQPVPNDAPSNLDPSVFTFEDAFEDLLAVSQGQPLPAISARYEQRKLLRAMFPDGEPAYFWLRRLKSQGILDMPSPGQLLAQVADTNWDYFHRELDRRAVNAWRAVTGEDSRDSRRVFEDDDSSPHSFRESPESEHVRRRRNEPEHFDDFFSSVQSSFSNSQSSWDTFVKSITDNPSTSLAKSQQDRSLDKSQEVIKDEYVDRFGYLHSKVTVKTLDEDGNQIGSQTHYTVRPADKQSDESKDGDDKSGINAKGSVETKAGWLWK